MLNCLDRIPNLFAASWLGHGRATEFMLSCVCGIYGVILLVVPGGIWDSEATRDLVWFGYGPYISIPFFLKAALSGSGLLFNVRGYGYSRTLRFLGAMVGCFIWVWYGVKFVLVGSVAALGMPFCIMSALFSIRIMAMAMSDLPKPSAPGRM